MKTAVKKIGLFLAVMIIGSWTSSSKAWADAGHDAQLLEAARNGNVGQIQGLIKKDANIEAKETDEGLKVAGLYALGGTPLLEAAAGGHLDAVNALIEKGANANAETRDNVTTLTLAVRQGDADVVAALTKAGANPNAPSNIMPLAQAAAAGRMDVVKTLLQAGALINGRDAGWSRTAMIWAAMTHRLEMIAFLADNGADVNASDLDGNTALSEAAGLCRLDTISALIGRGADVNAREGEALGAAAEKCDAGMVKFLIQKGDPAKTDYNEALWLAAVNGHADSVQLLIDAGASANVRQDSRPDSTPLLSAVAHVGQGDWGSIAKILIANGAAIDAKDYNDDTALILAAQRRRADLVKTLVDAGADIDAANKQGLTALDWAESIGPDEVLQILLDARTAKEKARQRTQDRDHAQQEGRDHAAQMATALGQRR